MNPRIVMVGGIELNNQTEIDSGAKEFGLTAFVKAEAAEFRYTGPVLLINTPAGTRRARGLFKDREGDWLIDTELVAESLYPARKDMREFLTDAIGGGAGPVYEVSVVTLSRGEHHALLTTMADIEFHAQVEVTDMMPAEFGWARGWESLPWVSDDSAIELRSLGVPTA